MKKSLVVISMLMSMQTAHSATVQLAALSGRGGITGSTTQTMHDLNSSAYYKCSNSVNVQCGNFYGIMLTYTDKNGGNGQQNNPYILNGCDNIKCLCNRSSYCGTSSCLPCSNNTSPVLSSSTARFHTNTSCSYCSNNYLKTSSGSAPDGSGMKCESCPSNATCDGSATFVCKKNYYKNASSCIECPSSGQTDAAGATSITSCYLPNDASFCDTYGSGVIYGGKCYYK